MNPDTLVLIKFYLDWRVLFENYALRHPGITVTS